MQLVIVSGLSGSGKSIALQTLEDMGYYCIDNLPIGLLEAFTALMMKSERPGYERVAVGIDARSEAENLKHLPKILDGLRATETETEIIVLAADRETLLKRFSETRRRHPLSSDSISLSEAIALEVKLLAPITSYADLHIDTTHTSIHELRDLIKKRSIGIKAQDISLLIKSFGFKHGIPRDADFVFDARCLPNPHWEPKLRPHTGKDQPVIDFLESQPDVLEMLSDIEGYLDKWIPCFQAENRNYLTVAIGCTGGQHRSVYLCEQLGKAFQERGRPALIRHRELT